MQYVGIVVIIALIEYIYFTMATGKARSEAGIQAPAVSGDTKFECYLRVQQNTLENLIVFIPAIYLLATYTHPLAAASIGLVFVIGRALFYKAYINDPSKRGPGMMMTMLSNVVLLLGGLVGIVMHLL